MNQLTTTELRTIQLEMMTYIDKICRTQNIHYSLSAGSLLGAVKYNGYVPWDDDIDIMLTRPNYEKLMQAFIEKLPSHLSLLYYKVCDTYLPMAKLYDNRTYLKSTLDTLNEGTGVFVDIFPLDTLPDNQVEGEKFKKEIRKAVTHLTASHKGIAYASAEKLQYFLGKSILWLPAHLKYRGKTHFLAEQVDQLMQKYNKSDNHYCNYVFSPPKRTGYFEKREFSEYEDVQFEDLILQKIKDHEAYLSELYGDWRQPPKTKRTHGYYRWYWRDEITSLEDHH